MDTIKNIIIPQNRVSEFCKRWNIVELSLFGSVLRDDFDRESDIDFLATFAPEVTWTLFDHVTMEDQLKEIFDREVDLVTRNAVERSRNRIRRRTILNSSKVIYVAS